MIEAAGARGHDATSDEKKAADAFGAGSSLPPDTPTIGQAALYVVSAAKPFE